jgi:hypothetical protein
LIDGVITEKNFLSFERKKNWEYYF